MEKICEKEQRSRSMEAGTYRYNGLSGILIHEYFSNQVIPNYSVLSNLFVSP